ncbi:MAG TPA: prolipoprotein diacylglyceryl transferase [Candidatus Sumerlaeota bacterium]|nr:MAG: Prolipoprotein diacylglyceryl transferase [candidate division BRC1 bacterium ADurb.BinA292]HOE95483.1 prolipoprotein diacylglyceryl transferase [Candidatus Sumerlaeota bacterium]HOR26389.1 prolipoprotein diacylglyceryl transferase [Candidatus Sumerlaeota bacterium]
MNDYWVHDLDPFLIRIGAGGIRYYGLAYVCGFVAGWWLLRHYHRRGRSPLDPDRIYTAITALALGVLIGGRLGYLLLYAPGDTLRDPLLVFRIWEGGMASHGGFLGVAVALAWLARRFKVSFLLLGDLLCSIAPLGLLLGRIANFINGELPGRVTDVPWAVIFPTSAPPGTPLSQIPPRHPSQLYEAGLEGLLLFVYLQWRFWRTNALATPGRLSAEFLLLYAIVRMVGEQFREPDAPPILGLTRGAFYSLFLILAAGAVWAWSRRSNRAQP